MKKLIFIAIGFIWLVIFSIVMFVVLSAPDMDVLKVLQVYKQVNKTYLDRKEIDPNSFFEGDKLRPDEEFVRIYAKFLKSLQQSEQAYNAEKRLAMVIFEPQNLLNPTTLATATQKLEALSAQTIKAYETMVTAQTTAQAELRALNGEDMEIFDPEAGAAGYDELYSPYREKITQSRLGLEKFMKAAVEFLLSRQAEITVENDMVKFFQPADQKYYNDLIASIQQYERSIIYIADQFQGDMRSINDQIPISAE